jgi:hypothetical protein
MNQLRTTTTKTVLSLLTALAAFAVAQTSDAGASYPSSAYCNWNTDGSGACSGTLAAFRASSDPNAYAAFFSNSAYSSVEGQLNGRFFYCVASPSQVPVVQTLASATPTAFFTVWFNTTGSCTNLQVYSLSQFL